MVLHRMRLSCTFQDKDGETIGKKSEGQGRSMYDSLRLRYIVTKLG